MRTSAITALALSLATAAGCGAYEPEPGQIDHSLLTGPKPTETYFRVRPDYRRCMFPFCGGYWVSQVNTKRTVCPDGGETCSSRSATTIQSSSSTPALAR